MLAASRKNYWQALHENFTRDVSLDEKELITFSKSPALDPDLGIFRDFATLQCGAFFHALAHISGWKNMTFMIFLYSCICGQKSPIKFLKSSQYGLMFRTGSVLAEVCALPVLLFIIVRSVNGCWLEINSWWRSQLRAGLDAVKYYGRWVDGECHSTMKTLFIAVISHARIAYCVW